MGEEMEDMEEEGRRTWRRWRMEEDEGNAEGGDGGGGEGMAKQQQPQHLAAPWDTSLHHLCFHTRRRKLHLQWCPRLRIFLLQRAV